MDNDSLTFDNPSAEDWDIVAQTNYSEEFADYEIDLANDILTIFKKYNLVDSTIIEIGSGSGHLSAIFAKNGFKTTLVDYSKEAILKSKKFFEKLNLQASFVQGHITELTKFTKNSYDIVFSSGVLEHFDDKDLLKILKESYQICNKFLIFLVPNPRSLPYLLFRMKAMKNGDWLYGKEYLRDNYDCFIKNAGFKVQGKEFIGMKFSQSHMDYVFQECEGNKHFSDLVKYNLIPKEEAYLTAFIAIKEK